MTCNLPVGHTLCIRRRPRDGARTCTSLLATAISWPAGRRPVVSKKTAFHSGLLNSSFGEAPARSKSLSLRFASGQPAAPCPAEGTGREWRRAEGGVERPAGRSETHNSTDRPRNTARASYQSAAFPSSIRLPSHRWRELGRAGCAGHCRCWPDLLRRVARRGRKTPTRTAIQRIDSEGSFLLEPGIES